MSRKVKVIISSIAAVIVVTLLAVQYTVSYGIPKYQAEQKYAEYLKRFYGDISFSVGYNFKTEDFSAHCVNKTTKEKFSVSEHGDGDFSVTYHSSYMKWIEKKSKFVGYEITDKNTVQLRYSLCFENNEDWDLSVSYISAEFDEEKLNGWMDYREAFVGYIEGAEDKNIIVKSGEKKMVDVIFEGTYLGGKVNADMSLLDWTRAEVVPVDK
ncbi:MAG: hypothetical protein IJF54_01605 [Clostridia bacterium]|nr:hypothetical protein [Clostridia bacterium]